MQKGFINLFVKTLQTSKYALLTSKILQLNIKINLETSFICWLMAAHRLKYCLPQLSYKKLKIYWWWTIALWNV